MDLKDYTYDLACLIKLSLENQLREIERYIQNNDEYVNSIFNKPIQFGNSNTFSFEDKLIRSTIRINLSLKEGL